MQRVMRKSALVARKVTTCLKGCVRTATKVVRHVRVARAMYAMVVIIWMKVHVLNASRNILIAFHVIPMDVMSVRRLAII